MCEGSPYIYPPFKVAASRSNGSGIENGVEVSLADVSWGGWVLLIVLRDEVWYLDIGGVTNFIRPYLHQFSIDSHGLNGYGKPLKGPFDRYQSRLEAINNGRDIRQINW